jgi:dolichyl-phosphate beta-glucosyltransferase
MGAADGSMAAIRSLSGVAHGVPHVGVSGAEQTPPPHLSLIIPAYNEASRLGRHLSHLIAFLSDRWYTTELLVVSDGSTDGTRQVVEAHFAAIETSAPLRALCLEYHPNAGKGRAVRTGVLASRGNHVAFTDADLSTSIEEVDRALTVLGALDKPGSRIVIGSRAVRGARVGQKQPLYRRLSARVFNLLRDVITGVHTLRDTQCGLKVFDGPLARAIFAIQVIDGFMFDVETVYIAQRMGIVISELGVTWNDDPESRVRLSSALRLLPDLVRIRMLHRRIRPEHHEAIVAPWMTNRA